MAQFKQNIKKATPWIILFSVLVGIIIFQWVGNVSNNKSKRLISVVGECNGRVQKDKTAVTLRIQTLAKSGAESMAMARNSYNVIAAMLGQFNGIEKQTVRWESFEKTEWKNDHQETQGIQTIISVDVSSKNTTDIEEILSRAEKMQNVFPENLRMFASNEKLRPAMDACINDAVQNARAKAEIIARSEGGNLGKMISAEYGASSDVNMPQSSTMMKLADESLGGAGLLTTDAEFSLTIRASFTIK